jgi:mannose-1-phosphate guanylyltransferase
MSHAAAGRTDDVWGVVLAGGDGVRLRTLTRALAGDERPKQFCRILGARTLLDQTRERLAHVVAPGRTLLVVNRAHERYYRAALADVAPTAIVAQPGNRGTAPAILYALLRLGALAPSAAVVMSPADHHVSDDAAFMAHVATALEAVRAHPGVVVLLGITPDRAETDYGWIEPATPDTAAAPRGHAVRRVRRFWEKPEAALAARLLAAGCLWNSFVLVARAAALTGLVRDGAPALHHAFAAMPRWLGTDREGDAAAELYARLPSTDFSRDVLARSAPSLGVLQVDGVTWSDLGDPVRVQAIRERRADVALAAAAGR